jgi:type IV pilus assembly protein PilY1
VLSKIVSFGAKLYANISGTSINTNKTDIVVLNAVDTGLVNYRSSWRQNF